MSTDDPDDLEDELPDSLAAFDEAEPKALFDALIEAGVTLPRPYDRDRLLPQAEDRIDGPVM